LAIVFTTLLALALVTTAEVETLADTTVASPSPSLGGDRSR
jgi:hypothetical protein